LVGLGYREEEVEEVFEGVVLNVEKVDGGAEGDEAKRAGGETGEEGQVAAMEE